MSCGEYARSKLINSLGLLDEQGRGVGLTIQRGLKIQRFGGGKQKQHGNSGLREASRPVYR